MKENESFNRYQYSIMFGRNREKQMVARGNDWDTFTEDVKKLNDIVTIVNDKVAKENEPQQTGKTSTCPIHNEAMYESISKKTGRPFFSHKGPDGRYCYGKEERQQYSQPYRRY